MTYTNKFTFRNKKYGYNNGKLYRLPYTTTRQFQESECAKYILNGVHVGYCLGSSKKKFWQLDEMSGNER